jgi:DNA-binding response OmpR family regulator
MNNADYLLLVVDDEETTRRSLADILSLEGYQVKSARNGDEAIALISENPFDLLLLDLKMPGTDGLDVLRYVTGDEYYAQQVHRISSSLINNSPGTREIVRPTVILLTAHGSLESAIEALHYGAQDYLLKPSSPGQILNSVTRGLEARAELLQKQSLLEQLESSIQKLTKVDKEQADKLKSQIVVLENGITFDLTRREIRFKELQVKLTPTEGKLLSVFLKNANRVFTHRELVLLVQGYEIKDWGAAEILRPLVSRLRKKLVLFPQGENWIVSIRGTGYLFDPAMK